MSTIDQNISKAIFKITTSSGCGTGFYLKNKGVIVTNCHVILGFKEVAIEDQNKDRYLAKVVFINPEADVAFLKPEKDFDAPVLEIADVATLQTRDKVLVLGYPYGMPFTITEGIVSSACQPLNGRNYIQTDAAVNPGNSGGPIVNVSSQVVGITTCKFDSADNMGFAIPADVLLEELNSLSNNPEFLYSIKCNSCKSLIFEKTEYCQNCGNKINPELFDETAPTHITVFVEDTLKQLGVNPILARAGNEFWEFHQGSALLRFFIYDNNYLTATSPLSFMPTSNIDKLLKYLLSNPVAPYQLGVYNNQVYISYRVHISEIYSNYAEEVKKLFVGMPLKADDMDDLLEKEYGCQKSNYAKKIA